jgi:hypothetical protein
MRIVSRVGDGQVSKESSLLIPFIKCKYLIPIFLGWHCGNSVLLVSAQAIIMREVTK